MLAFQFNLPFYMLWTYLIFHRTLVFFLFAEGVAGRNPIPRTRLIGTACEFNSRRTPQHGSLRRLFIVPTTT